ncbi:hypothetical protein D3C84_1067970 [compost metagenome]
MVLLLYLLMSRMISTRSGENARASTLALLGVAARRSVPWMLPPSSFQIARTAPAV